MGSFISRCPKAHRPLCSPTCQYSEVQPCTCSISGTKECSQFPKLHISNSAVAGFKQSTKGTVCNGLQSWSQGEILNWVQTSINQSWTVSFHNSIFIFCLLSVVHIVFMRVQGQFVPPLPWQWWLPPGSRAMCCLSRVGGKCLLSSQPACWAPNTHMAFPNKQQLPLIPWILMNWPLFSNPLVCLLQPPASLCRSPPSPLPSWLLPGRGREELFIVCLLKMKGFYILMSTK